ncbi:SDR family NAD(P)-dependent oxidoreductase [Marinicella sediminis]|uniref:SDR family NAD(P)-dependent oxidoreductase n=1 Tax=Marinicella sediminis TaxID=1792834 RepID=A0ABV7JD24_9GAMM|nr:SDR family NAD(P)-dependent oxidoreductase [Marinicella sediminis]
MKKQKLRTATDNLLKSIISEVSSIPTEQLDSGTPFLELGIDSFYVLKIIKKLEDVFGKLSKTLLFENFDINDLSQYFVENHEAVLLEKFASNKPANSAAKISSEAPSSVAKPINRQSELMQPIVISERLALADEHLGPLVQSIYDEHKGESSVSRGTRIIAPQLFIGADRQGYIHFSQYGQLVLAYAYTGPDSYFETIVNEFLVYSRKQNLEFNLLVNQHLRQIGSTNVTATPFGALQRVHGLQQFSLQGGKMRRLRYLVNKFEKAGECQTEEFIVGSNEQIAQQIVDVIDQWCSTRTQVNPLVHVARQEILDGTLDKQHRIFTTRINGDLQNVVIISPLSKKLNGYLMDLEFYPQDMPLGGLEYTIVEIIDVLIGEGCDLLSLGATLGPKLEEPDNKDDDVDGLLDNLREQNIFNDIGNLQFKNKFRPENNTIYLCREATNQNSESAIDVVMMIADPKRMQTLTTSQASHEEGSSQVEPAIQSAPKTAPQINAVNHLQSGAFDGRAELLSCHHFNPLAVNSKDVPIDLSTDSWAQLDPSVTEDHMQVLYQQLHRSNDLTATLKKIFPFSYFVLTESGRTAESVLCEAWQGTAKVLQNLLFPTWVFSEIQHGLNPVEIPHPHVFETGSNVLFAGGVDVPALKAQVLDAEDDIAFVVIEVSNNASGGLPVSLDELKTVKAFLTEHEVPLVMDATRIIENAIFVDAQKAGEKTDLWNTVHEILRCADAITVSLAKDFGVNTGGLIATNDQSLWHQLTKLTDAKGCGLDVIDKKLIAAALHSRSRIESLVAARMDAVVQISAALKEHNFPVQHTTGGHCIIVDVKQIPELQNFAYPVESFLAWLFLKTGIRAGSHSVGMQKHSRLKGLVRLAIPVGLSADSVQQIVDALMQFSQQLDTIPEITLNEQHNAEYQPGNKQYLLVKYHQVAGSGEDQLISEPVKQRPEPQTTNQNISQAIEVRPVDNRGTNSNDIAVVGVAGRYPKADNLAALWDNLLNGKDCITDLPMERVKKRLKSARPLNYRGGFVSDIDKFDSLFFNISPREAEMLDPQERLFLEVAYEAIEDAGYYPEILGEGEGPHKVGVYVGAVWAMFQMIGVDEKAHNNTVNPNSFLWSIANRVSYWMNLSGPSMTIDTACSSSLTSIYLAVEGILNGECTSAIAGGVNLDLHQSKQEILVSGGTMSEDGYCRSFGEGANGYVAGEGIGAIYLKPLAQAEQDNDNIHGVIKSVVVNHGGRSGGYTVPNPKAQSGLVLDALKRGGVDARTIGYIEAHGTGTELGDPIEITGLTQAFADYNVEQQSCSVGSVKSNIGHLEAAAGIVGVCKVLLQMRHQTLVPSLHSSTLNEFIEFESTPFVVQQQAESWLPKEIDGITYPLRAGISSFGAGGANAHIIVESYQATDLPVDLSDDRDLYVFPISARSEPQLKDVARRLKQHVENQNGTDPNNVAYTLQLRRKSFDHRAVVLASDINELAERLGLLLADEASPFIISGVVKSTQGISGVLDGTEQQSFAQMLYDKYDPFKLAQLWAEGFLQDWQGFRDLIKGITVSLPTYPFADKRHWPEEAEPTQTASAGAFIHPMIDVNESTFERQVFKKTFMDDQFYIYDHLVSAIPTLPGVAYLDLARSTAELALGRKVQKIQNILWVSPLTVQDHQPTIAKTELKIQNGQVHFETFSEGEDHHKQLYSQGRVSYQTPEDTAAQDEYIDIQAIKKRTTFTIEGKDAYPLFKDLGLYLGPSFQVLQEVYKNDDEALGRLVLPAARVLDLKSFVLHPSLMDGSLQVAMAAAIGDDVDELFVPYTIGEVEVLHPLTEECYSYVTAVKEAKKSKSNLSKMNVVIADGTGKVLVKVRECVGVPLTEVHEKPNEKGVVPLSYAPQWESTPLPVHLPNTVDTVLLFEDVDHPFSGISASDQQVIRVHQSEQFEVKSNGLYGLNPENPADFVQLVGDLQQKGHTIQNICFTWGAHSLPKNESQLADAALLKPALNTGIFALMHLSQALLAGNIKDKVQIIYAYHSSEPGHFPLHAAVSGFANTLKQEGHKFSCKTVELIGDQQTAGRSWELMFQEFAINAHQVEVVRYQGEDRYIKRTLATTKPVFAGNDDSLAAPIKHRGTYLISGGAGGLGLIFAEHLAREYQANLVLLGRSSMSAQLEEKLTALTHLGGQVEYISTDITDGEEVANALARGRERFGHFDGIIHAAGCLRDAYIRDKNSEDFYAVLAPKLLGAVHLDQHSREDNLNFFVMCSSMSAVGGNAGQCDYAFANSYMDAFAHKRQRLTESDMRCGNTLSFNWSIWAEGGMQIDEATAVFFKNNLGIVPLSVKTGLSALLGGIASGYPQIAIMEGEREKVEQVFGFTEQVDTTPVLSEESESSNDKRTAAAEPAEANSELSQLVKKQLTQMVMDFLKLDESDISSDAILLDLGFDSIGLTSFANLINEHYALNVTPVLFFEYPSIDDVTTCLTEEHQEAVSKVHSTSGASSSREKATAAKPIPLQEVQNPSTLLDIQSKWPAGVETTSEQQTVSLANRFTDQPIAIVGISGSMPQSENLDEYWDNLANAVNMITEIPRDRWNWEDYYGDPLKEDNKSNSKWGGFMKEIDKFDSLFFGISPHEAEFMDPQQRLFLECVWAAVEDSGHKIADLSGTKTGLFVGVATNDYVDIMATNDIGIEAYTSTGNSHSVLVNRVSYLLDVHGPSAPLDTACSSSLVAIHRALESIHCGSCDMAIAGGVQVMASPSGFITFGKAGMLSPDGKCKTFDSRADGYVRGEGVGAIFLKPLSQAEADGNPIYAVIKATGENHGGKANALTAPNPNAQSELLIDVYEKAHVDPSTIGYIECHGTGTSLGDPIEIQGLKRTFNELYKRAGTEQPAAPHCGIGSVKTNIGHLETAAGIAGILKLVLSIQNKQIPASLHVQEVNPYIDLTGTPFYIVKETQPWIPAKDSNGKDLPRRGGVSSFGFGGANAHILLEEYLPPEVMPVANEHDLFVIPLSAKTETSLKTYVHKLLRFLHKNTVDMNGLAYTLQVGRDTMIHKLCVVATNQTDLVDKLGDVAQGNTDHPDVFTNISGPALQGPDKTEVREFQLDKMASQDWSAIAAAWVSDSAIDWTLLYGAKKPQRLSVVTYPFERNRHWIINESNAGKGKAGHHGEELSTIHPLVHMNVSTLTAQKFATMLNGQEFFLTEHVVDGKKILPGVAYMEMARKAGELSVGSQVTTIRDLVWFKPYIHDDNDSGQLAITMHPGKMQVGFDVTHFKAGENTVLSKGALSFDQHAHPRQQLDIKAIQSRCTELAYDAPGLYSLLHNSGLELDKGFQIVQTIHASQTEALSVLQLPAHLQQGADDYLLHPALMDGSLHTSMGLLKLNQIDKALNLPFSVEEIQIYGPLTELHYGYVTWSDENASSSQGDHRVTVTLLDHDGVVLVRMKNFLSKPFDRSNFGKIFGKPLPSGAVEPTVVGEQLNALAPVWEVLPQSPESQPAVTPAEGVYLVCSTADQEQWLREDFGHIQKSRWVTAPTSEEVDRITSAKFDELVWVAPDVQQEAQSAEDFQAMIEEQERGVIALFKLTRALINDKKGSQPLKLTIITQGAVLVTQRQSINPCHSGVIGFVGSLAKECPHWDIRLLDIESLHTTQAKSCLSQPFDPMGNPLAHRNGQWYRMGLGQVELGKEFKPVYKAGGVYVILGGAGGLGELLSSHLIEQYDAKIVWIGRSEFNAEIKAKCELLGEKGNQPLYFQADATDLNSLKSMASELQKIHPQINGVVHSAIVLKDQSIAQMSDEAFTKTLRAKVDTSVNLQSVFRDCELDFMLFFSSIISFFKTPGQSNYSAGCTFKDAFASAISASNKWVTKVINWGYWGNIGIVGNEGYRKIMEGAGIGSIESEEGLEALQQLMEGPFDQLGLIKTLGTKALKNLSVKETLAPARQFTSTQVVDMSQLETANLPPDELKALENEYNSSELDELAGQLLASILRHSGVDLEQPDTKANMDADVPEFYREWLHSTLTYLHNHDLTSADATISTETLWNQWHAATARWSTNPNRKAQITLLETCLKSLPEVLQGRKLATEVMFPGSSMALVEGIYKDNVVADFYNRVLKEALKAQLDHLQTTAPQHKIRILEVGAGTGGTTSQLIPLLDGYKDRIDEYCYTDISKAFLLYAEQQYAPQMPYLKTSMFDVSKPLNQQATQFADYDIVIATNVLHATPNIRETIRNSKAILAKEGVLLINEIGTWTLFGHLTFGLLEGWWLYEDGELRIPGNPGLNSKTWQNVLFDEGFHAVQFPAKIADSLGQQIIVAQSDGLTRQVNGNEKESEPYPIPSQAPRQNQPIEHVEGQPTVKQTQDTTSFDSEDIMNTQIQDVIKQKLSAALKIEPGIIQNKTPFADYGVDSIIGVSLIRDINEALHIELETVVLFEHSNVESLAAYVTQNYAGTLAHQASDETAAVDAQVVEQTAQRTTQQSSQMGLSEIQNVIKQSLSSALKIEPGIIQNKTPFAEYGVDSIIGVSLIRDINSALHIDLETVVLFEHSNVESLAQHINKNHAVVSGQQAPEGTQPALVGQPQNNSVEPSTRLDLVNQESRFWNPSQREVQAEQHATLSQAEIEPIAVIGMSGRFSQADSLDEFWDHIQQGRELVDEVTRWPQAECAGSQINAEDYCTRGSFINGIDQFDAEFFRISPEEATYMDPQQRIFLEESWKALENAGYATDKIGGKQCGVYVGCGGSHYDSLITSEPPAQSFWGNSESMIPTRIAYELDLRGPTIAIDTACSSSLVTIHLACQGLWIRETEMALAGGIFLQPTPRFFQVANRASMLSGTGSCRSFDPQGDGFVPGEGAGVLVLKRLSDAQRDGDYIHGTIIGSGINQDGSSNGIIAPNAKAQIELLESVYERFEIDPASVQLLEAHGTGTAFGDSIEHLALKRVFDNKAQNGPTHALGSVKMNIGHTVGSAGVAGVLKLLLAMKNKQLPPTPHLEPAYETEGQDLSPFYVNTQLKEWTTENDQPRRAAASAFGFSGTNAHIILEEPGKRPGTIDQTLGNLIVFSARTAQQLQQKITDMIAWLETGQDFSLLDIGHTLLSGRSTFKHRLACVSRSAEELRLQLKGWLDTRESGFVFAGVVDGFTVKEQVALKNFGNYCIEQCEAHVVQPGEPDEGVYLEQLSTLGDLFVKGYQLNYSRLYGNTARRVPLPTYPFERSRFWVATEPLKAAQLAAKNNGQADSRSVIHPLLQQNQSDLSQLRFTSQISQSNRFVQKQGDQAIILPSTQLAMALLAIKASMPDKQASFVLHLTNTAWAQQPVVVEDSSHFEVSLLPLSKNQMGVELCRKTTDEVAVCLQSYVDLAAGELQPLTFDVTEFKAQAVVEHIAFENSFYHHGERVVVELCRSDESNVIDGLAAIDLAAIVIPARALLLREKPTEDYPAVIAVGFASLHLLMTAGAPQYVMIEHVDSGAVNVNILDAQGHILMVIEQLQFKQADRQPQNTGYIFHHPEHNDSVVEASSELVMTVEEKARVFVTQFIAGLLKTPTEQVATNLNYVELGVSSMGLAALIKELNHLLGVDILPSILFEHVTIEAFSNHLGAQFEKQLEQLRVFKIPESSDTRGAPSDAFVLQPMPRPKRPFYLGDHMQNQESQTTEQSNPQQLEDMLEMLKAGEDTDQDSTQKLTF